MSYGTSTPRIISMENLSDWFTDQNKPYWVLYAGHQSRLNRSNAIAVNDEDLGIEDSWNKLERSILVQVQGRSSFTVFVSEKSKQNYGLKTFLEIGDAVNAPVHAIGALPAADPLAAVGSILPGGIAGYLANEVGNATKIVSLQMELDRKRERIAELEDRLEQKDYTSPLNTFIGGILENPEVAIQGVTALIAAIKGATPMNPTALQYQKVAGEVVRKEDDACTMDPNANNGDASATDEDERINNALDRIAEKVDLVVALENIAAFLEYKPETANFLLNLETMKKAAAFL